MCIRDSDLRDKRNQRLWKGIDHSETDYSDQPWELEAHKMEEVLYREYEAVDN